MWTADTRARYERKSNRYPSDVTDEEWRLVKPHLPAQRRLVLNAILYVLTTGCQWRMLPKDFPPKSTVHDYFVEWMCTGILDRIYHALYVEVREQADRQASPTCAIVDAQSVKAAETYGPPAGKWFVSAGLNNLHKRIRPFSFKPLAKMEIRASWSS